jgi:hypothetical protein
VIELRIVSRMILTGDERSTRTWRWGIGCHLRDI